MSDIPITLARPLAARVTTLPEAYSPAQPMRPPNEAMLDAAAAALDAGKTHYTDRPGILPLRERIATMLKGSGLPIEPSAITITCGMAENRFVTLKQFVPNNGILWTTPDHEDDLAAVAELLHLTLTTNASSDAALLYVRGSDEFQMALDAASDTSIVCEWQAGDDYTAFENLSEHLQKIVFIGEFAQLPGWRVGFMAGSSAHNKLRAYKQSMTICTPSISQWAALGLFEGEQ